MSGRRTWTLAGATAGPTATGSPAEAPLNGLTGSLLGLVRIAIGFMWFQQTQWKPPPNFGCQADRAATPNSGLCDWIGTEIAQPKFDWYRTSYGVFIRRGATDYQLAVRTPRVRSSDPARIVGLS
jgi:hypothetical protein